MSERKAFIRSFNHTGESMGDAWRNGRVDYEDALIQVVEDVILGGRIEPFRHWLRDWAPEVGWPEEHYKRCLHSDSFAWETVMQLGTNMRRLMPYYEYCANWLLERGEQNFGEGLSNINF